MWIYTFFFSLCVQCTKEPSKRASERFRVKIVISIASHNCFGRRVVNCKKKEEKRKKNENFGSRCPWEKNANKKKEFHCVLWVELWTLKKCKEEREIYIKKREKLSQGLCLSLWRCQKMNKKELKGRKGKAYWSQ